MSNLDLVRNLFETNTGVWLTAKDVAYCLNGALTADQISPICAQLASENLLKVFDVGYDIGYRKN